MENHASDLAYNLIPNDRIFDVSALVSAHYFPFNPDRAPYRECYPFSQIVLILEGDGSLQTESGRYPFSVGDMLYRPARHSSTVEWNSKKIRFALISFICESEAIHAFSDAPLALSHAESEALLDLIKTATRICEPIEENESLLGMRIKADTPAGVLNYVYSSLERFLSMLYCRQKHPEIFSDEALKSNCYIDRSRLVMEAQRYLHEHLTESLSIAHICAHLHVSQTTLSKKFRAEMHCGVMEYFHHLKIEEAKCRISGTSLRFTEIADQLGFSSVNYFSKAFKAETGMTPTAYSRYVSKRQTTIL